MLFENALKALRQGHKVTHEEWKPGTHIEIRADGVQPELYMFYPDGFKAIWFPSARSLLSDKWAIYDVKV